MKRSIARSKVSRVSHHLLLSATPTKALCCPDSELGAASWARLKQLVRDLGLEDPAREQGIVLCGKADCLRICAAGPILRQHVIGGVPIGNGRLARAISDRPLAQATSPSSGGVLISRALGLSAQILREREGYYTVLERCQRGDLDGTGWLIWFLEQLIAAAHLNQAVIEAVRQKAACWWHHRHRGFNASQQKLINRLLDAEPEGFSGGLSLRKAIGLTRASRATAWRDLADLVAKQALEPIGAGRNSACRIRWPC